MKIEHLEKMARDAIAQYNQSAFKLSGKAIVQFYQSQSLPEEFPLPFEYLGKNKGKYVYNVEAQAILQYCDRYRAEFNIEGE